MDSKQAKKIIMEQFLNDSLLYKDKNYMCYGFNKILSQSIRQYTPTCWKSVVIADDSIKEQNIRLVEYVLNEGKLTSDEIRLNPQDVAALKIALANYN